MAEEVTEPDPERTSVAVHESTRVFLGLDNFEFEILPVPLLVETMGAAAAAEATANTLREALSRVIPRG